MLAVGALALGLALAGCEDARHILTTGEFAPWDTDDGGDYNVSGTGPAGGIVFYDKGNDDGGWRYLEGAAAPAERAGRPYSLNRRLRPSGSLPPVPRSPFPVPLRGGGAGAQGRGTHSLPPASRANGLRCASPIRPFAG
ncbi:MAG: hypothetical protein MdMp014T_2007 [Treponematales bacterium]